MNKLLKTLYRIVNRTSPTIKARIDNQKSLDRVHFAQMTISENAKNLYNWKAKQAQQKFSKIGG